MIPIINILLIVGILLFILYNLYVDTRNWSNTGSFLEGMENAGESINIPVGNSDTNSKTVTLPHQNMTVSPIPINPEHQANKYRDTFSVSVSGNQLTVTRTDSSGGWGQPLVLKGTVGEKSSTGAGSIDCAANFGSTTPSDGSNSGTVEAQYVCPEEQPICKDYKFNVKWGKCEAGSTDVGGATANNASSGSVSSAGSAASAMEDQIKTRAGDVAPMGSNVPQNCKKGCVAPTGPNGNCKVIQKDGAEKRECYYGCPNPTLEGGDTENCAYDRDCNSCGTVIFNPDDPPQIAQGPMGQGQMGQGQMAQGQMGQMAQGQMGQMAQGQMGQMGQMAQGQPMMSGVMSQSQMNQLGSMDMSVMDYQTGDSAATVAASNNSLFNEAIMKQVLANKDLIPNDINVNNEETSFNLRIGKKFMVDTAIIRNFALPNIDDQDYIELGRIVKKIKMIEKDPRDADQVKVLYSKLNVYVLELLTDSSLDMSHYDNKGMPKQINNKTRTTGMFGENSNSLIRGKRQKVKPYNSIWSLYQ